DYDKPLYLLTEERSLSDNLKGLRSIGIDNVAGYFDAAQVREAGLRTQGYRSEGPAELAARIQTGQVRLLDVRAAVEFKESHIPGAEHRFLGTLLRGINGLDRSKPVVTQCQSGGRSAIAASILQRAGFDVINLQGGLSAWLKAGLPVRSGGPEHR
ncbi:MAG: rhodanese-like domain-containing protein, partial [Phycisphaerae bacterium]|nr:rhodanese-like domain-containing protein [Phycisphaerae bacterium]MDW8262954.1 rhodanese-like domain-containing protein [Phycisphaerales bacterium]